MRIDSLFESASSSCDVNFDLRMGIPVAHFNRADVIEDLKDYDDEDAEEDPEVFVESIKDALHLPASEYIFKYDYPLTTEARFPHKLTEKTSILDILELAAADYKAIYDAEDDSASPDHKPSGTLLNRGTSNGDYGIWGHVIEDLVFVTVMVEGNEVSFNVDS